MKTSESITNIAKALVAFGKAMPKVPKDKINPHFKNKYATLSVMIEKATPHLQTHVTKKMNRSRRWSVSAIQTSINEIPNAVKDGASWTIVP